MPETLTRDGPSAGLRDTVEVTLRYARFTHLTTDGIPVRLSRSIGATCGLLLLGAACSHRPGDNGVAVGAALGECLMAEPGAEAITGISAFTVQTADRGGNGPGAQALVLTCELAAAAGGADGDRLTIILPNLRRGEHPTGTYQVRRGDVLPDTTVPLGRLAWAQLSRGAAGGIPYAAEGGTISFDQATADQVHGAYQLALQLADSDLSDGASDPRLVLEGAFVAPRVAVDAE